MISLKNIIYAIIKESNSCWDDPELDIDRKVPPNRIDLMDLPKIKLLKGVSDCNQTVVNTCEFGRVEYGITLAEYFFNAVFCKVFLNETVITIVPEHVELILKEIVKQIIYLIMKNDNGDLLSENDREIINLISEEIGDIEGNWVENPEAWDRVSCSILRHETIIRKIYIKARNHKECQDINLLLYLVHHEANHCASALLTWRRGTCNLNAWGEIWIDFCTFIEIEDFFVPPMSGYETPSDIRTYKSKLKHMIFTDYIINRAVANGKSLEEIFEAIWKYCFDKHIGKEDAREIIGAALNICEEHISELETKEKFDDVIIYCNSNVPNLKFIGKENFIEY